MVDWDAIKTLSLNDYDWYLQWYILQETDLALATEEFIPSLQHILPLGHREEQFWPPRPPAPRGPGSGGGREGGRGGGGGHRGKGCGGRDDGKGKPRGRGHHGLGEADGQDPSGDLGSDEQPHDDGAEVGDPGAQDELCALSDEEPDEGISDEHDPNVSNADERPAMLLVPDEVEEWAIENLHQNKFQAKI